MAMPVVLARCSAPERVRSSAPTAPAAERASACLVVEAGGLRACSDCCTCNNTSVARPTWTCAECHGSHPGYYGVIQRFYDDEGMNFRSEERRVGKESRSL